MRPAALHGASRRRQFRTTTVRDETAQPAPDLVERQFKTAGPDPAAVRIVVNLYGTRPALPVVPPTHLAGTPLALYGGVSVAATAQ